MSPLRRFLAEFAAVAMFCLVLAGFWVATPS